MAHLTLPGQGAEEVMQVPKPLQPVDVVSVPLLHEVGAHEVPLGGKMQSPVVSQPVAPQAPPVGHATLQQFPVPDTPHVPVAH